MQNKAILLMLTLPLFVGCASHSPKKSNHATKSRVQYHAMMKLGDKAQAAGNTKAALQAYRAAKFDARGTELSEVNQKLGALYNQQGEYGQAISAYQEVLKREPSNRQARLANINAYLGSRNPKGALDNIAVLLKENQRDPQVLSELGVILDMGGMHRQAQTCYKQGLSLERVNISTTNNYAMSMMLSGNFDGAIKQFNRALKQSPQQAQLKNNLKLALSLQDAVVKNNGWFANQKAIEVANKRFGMPRYSMSTSVQLAQSIVNQYCNPFTMAISQTHNQKPVNAKKQPIVTLTKANLEPKPEAVLAEKISRSMTAQPVKATLKPIQLVENKVGPATQAVTMADGQAFEERSATQQKWPFNSRSFKRNRSAERDRLSAKKAKPSVRSQTLKQAANQISKQTQLVEPAAVPENFVRRAQQLDEFDQAFFAAAETVLPAKMVTAKKNPNSNMKSRQEQKPIIVSAQKKSFKANKTVNAVAKTTTPPAGGFMRAFASLSHAKPSIKTPTKSLRRQPVSAGTLPEKKYKTITKKSKTPRSELKAKPTMTSAKTIKPSIRLAQQKPARPKATVSAKTSPVKQVAVSKISARSKHSRPKQPVVTQQRATLKPAAQQTSSKNPRRVIASSRHQQKNARILTSDEKKIMAKNAKNYTLVLVANTDKDALKKIIQSNPPLSQLKIYSSHGKKSTMYFVSYGEFTNAEAANNALFDLPIEWQRWVPNVQQYQTLQQHINR